MLRRQEKEDRNPITQNPNGALSISKMGIANPRNEEEEKLVVPSHNQNGDAK